MLKYVCEFEVVGTGEFPFDMLRYDRCSPYASQDASSIGLNWHTGDMKTLAGERTIKLIRFTEGKGRNFNDNPTDARWRSFGWRVANVEFRKL